ncbi:hypothetical protein SAMN05660477_01112 [Soonwooa buanensis]|uniref:Tetratricopeptide repeat-containing protein n=1 Tax=Soonwooa buanensis TaxID=619805 RepID=A0A1T5E594_9FLAO|nr:tetratricopeptide repeat protein [Soonwooa buanensis]SKB78973.1 hypothetical protein SAMN05660477_01112 [Soonwooa buanensis]
MKSFLKYHSRILLIMLLIFGVHVFAQKPTKDYKSELKKIGDLYIQYQKEGKTDKILDMAQEFYPLAVKSGNDTIMQKAYNLLGNAYSGTSEFGLALDYYLKSLALSEKLKTDFRTAIANENLSFCFYQIGNYQKGAETGKKAVNILLSLPKKEKEYPGYIPNMINSYDNFALNLLKLNRINEALASVKKGLIYAKKSTHPDDIYFTTGIVTDYALINFKAGNFSEAELNFKKVDSIVRANSMEQSLAYNSTSYAELLYANGRSQEAIKIAKDGFDAAIKTKDKLSAIGLADILQKAYDQEKNIAKAYEYSKISNELRNEIYTAHNLTTLQNLTFKRENIEREMALKKEKEKQERAENLQNAAIAIGLLAFLILFLIISHKVKVHPNFIRFLGTFSMLLVFEFLNLLLHPYIGEWTHHQPFLMLLSLACIAGILIPLHHKLEHLIVHKLLEKNEKLKRQKPKI